MNIVTSYFAKADKLPAAMEQVAICLYRPKRFHGLQLKTLAPSATLLHDYKCTKDIAFYSARFKAYLNSLDFSAVMQELEEVGRGRDIALLCYEKSDDFCHRHLVAEWLSSHGQPCEEYKFRRVS